MKAWLQILRLPAVFTAMADIFAGFILSHRSLQPVNQFLLLLGSSSCLYLAGMVLNDYFDCDLDALERPERPIPSGRISANIALCAGFFLLIAGTGLAFLAGPTSAIVAGILAFFVVSYDALTKGSWLGPINMGLCRGLNLLLGASAGGAFIEIFAQPQLMAALAMGTYIAGVTLFARDEAHGVPGQLSASTKISLIGGMLGVAAGLGLLCAMFASTPDAAGNPQTAWFVTLLIGFSAIRRMLIAIRTPSPQIIQSTVKLLLFSYVICSGVVVHWTTDNPWLSLGTVALLIPAMLLGRLIRLT